jgi:hypothetical protein
MLDRLRFWWRAVSQGGTRLNTWAGWFGLIVLVLGVAAGVTVPLVFHLSHWVTAVILMGAALVVVAEGSDLEWKEADTKRRESVHLARPEPSLFRLRYYTGTPPEYGGLMAGRPRDSLVFTAPHGGPVTDGHFRNRVWYPAVEAAGIC